MTVTRKMAAAAAARHSGNPRCGRCNHERRLHGMDVSHHTASIPEGFGSSARATRPDYMVSENGSDVEPHVKTAWGFLKGNGCIVTLMQR